MSDEEHYSCVGCNFFNAAERLRRGMVVLTQKRSNPAPGTSDKHEGKLHSVIGMHKTSIELARSFNFLHHRFLKVHSLLQLTLSKD